MNNETIERIRCLLDSEKFNECRELITKTIESTQINESGSIPLLLELYGFLTDLGNESMCEADLLKSINFLETNKHHIDKYIAESYYFYNLANAKDGLAKKYYLESHGTLSFDTISNKLQEPVNLYWKAYKKIRNSEGLLFEEILINLSNSLLRTNRIVEALQFLDIVLKTNPKYPQALVSKGDSLMRFLAYTNCPQTTNLFTQIYICFDEAIKTNKLPSPILNRCMFFKDEYMNLLNDANYKAERISVDKKQTDLEFLKHSNFRQFSINSFLTLNEHSIYCGCIASKKDNIQIGIPGAVFKDEIVPKIELLLNRLKSEFAFARRLYYQAVEEKTDINLDTQYSELFEGEEIDGRVEMLRSGFRLCYGILDKIAYGICKTYNIDIRHIHFESFWEKKEVKGKLNQINNPHLFALYSIACDLNAKTGELNHFKKWRNNLEHNLLIIRDTKKFNADLFGACKDDFAEVVDLQDFQNKTLHLLQVTRAAVFSFVYCARFETIDSMYDKETGFPITNNIKLK